MTRHNAPMATSCRYSSASVTSFAITSMLLEIFWWYEEGKQHQCLHIPAGLGVPLAKGLTFGVLPTLETSPLSPVAAIQAWGQCMKHPTRGLPSSQCLSPRCTLLRLNST